MSASRIKITLLTVCFAFLAGTAQAEIAPLALPPSSDAPAAEASPSTPESMGLALAPPPVEAPPAPQPAAAPDAVTPQIETAPLQNIKPGSVGLLAASEGGLGAGMWKGTSLSLVESFMPMLSLPLPFASLNNLAGRFLLTAAGAPEGDAGTAPHQSLTAVRVNKLVALGRAAEAWHLANLANADQIDDVSLRQSAENGLVSPAADDVCAKLPEIIKTHTAIEWQKTMAVCQLRVKDVKAAQVSLDLLHAQDAHDDLFFALAEKTIIAGGKQLPRQLTPLKPLTLALLRLTDFPLRSEVYARPDAALIPELLHAKAADEKARLALAERVAEKDVISAGFLGDIYNSETFAPDALTNPASSGVEGPLLRALLYQAAQQEKDPQIRIHEAVKFLGSFEGGVMGGGVLTAMGSMIGAAQPSGEFNDSAATVTRIYLMAGQPDHAEAWLEQARAAARGMPQAASDLQTMWPLIALGGLESDKDFAEDLDKWLGATLRPFDPDDHDARDKNAATVGLVLLMDAAGFPVGDNAWAKIAGAAAPEKMMMPPAMVLEKLRSSAAANRKGEAVLMALLAENGGKSDPPLFATLETIKALRAIGLASDAGELAKEAALRILYPPAKP